MRAAPQIERLVEQLGATAVAFLGRQLCAADAARRDAARDALALIAGQGPDPRARVTAVLHAVTSGAADDGAKVVALGLLSELGEHADARFADPQAIRVRSAIALAAHLETAADVAGAADLMVRELLTDDIVQMIEIMADAAPDAAQRLAAELAVRLDLPSETRERIAALAPRGADAACPPRPARPADGAVHAQVLVDAAARLVVIASRKRAGSRRWRRWAVLIGASGRIDDCLHEDDAGCDGDAAALAAALCRDGYRVASSEPGRAREVVAQAARRTVESTRALPSPYYLGRDLLELADTHVGGRRDPAAALLARAIELVATGDCERAMPLLERCDLSGPGAPDAAAALAACHLAAHRPEAALAALDRALSAEPDWPLHHWNRAAALHQLGDPRGCYHALRRFVATSAIPTGLFADPDQPVRLACAERLIAELARTTRTSGRKLGRRARKRRSSASR